MLQLLLKEAKEKGEEAEWRRRKGRGQMPFSPFLFQENSLVSAPLSSEACRLRLRGNGCINELLFFFFRGHFFPLHFLPLSLSFSPFPLLRRLHQTPSLQLSTHSPAHWLSSFTSQEPLGGFRFFICYNHVEKEFLRHRLKLARTFHFTHRKNVE